MRRLGVYQRSQGIHKETLAEHEWWLPIWHACLKPRRYTLLMGQTMDQGSATADLTLSIIVWADGQKWSRKQFRQLSFSDRMRQWLEKSSIRHVDILSKTPVRNREYVYLPYAHTACRFMRILPDLCAYGLPVYVHMALMNHNRALQHPQRS